MTLLEDLRTITGVGSDQYEIDGVSYWTEEQLTALLEKYEDDVHAAAAEVFDSWSAAVATAYDVEMDGQSLKRSQMAERLQKLASAQRELATGGTEGVPGTIPYESNMGLAASNPEWPGFEESS